MPLPLMYRLTTGETPPPITSLHGGFVLSRYDTSRTETASSYSTVYGIGSDAGLFIYWFGEQVLGICDDVVVRVKLLSMQRWVMRKGIVEHVGPGHVKAVRDACDSLVEFCRDDYSRSTRRKALLLLLALLKPLDAWSRILLQSNFVEVLEDYAVARGDAVMAETFEELLRIVGAFKALPCQCNPCIYALRMRIWDIMVARVGENCGRRVHCCRKSIYTDVLASRNALKGATLSPAVEHNTC